MDLKVMLRLYKGHKYVLYIIDEVTDYLIMVLIHQSRSEEISNALIENVISKYHVPHYMIMDQDSAFMSSLMNYLFKKPNIKIKTMAPYSHLSLPAEHRIRLLSTILTRHFDKYRSDVAKIFISGYILYKTSNTPNLANYSPYNLVFCRNPWLL